MIDKELIEQAKAHAIREFPREACGFVLSGREYRECENAAENPEEDFSISTEQYSAYSLQITHLIHSHPNGQDWPSERDMRSQMSTAIPWGIIACGPSSTKEIVWFGDQAPVPDLIGRKFRHGVTDCYALVRDWLRLERNITVPNFPRADKWWEKGGDMFVTEMQRAGFFLIDEIEKPGDCIVGKVGFGPGPLNHCGVYVGENLVLHHLTGRLSRREPIGPWLRHAQLKMRHRSQNA